VFDFRLYNNDLLKDAGYGHNDQSEQIDIAVDALNSGVAFSKTKAFEVELLVLIV
jgi:hypothetical protein